MKATPKPSPLAALAIGLITIYQRILSPRLGGNCRFWPTCSQYSKEAVIEHGVWRGVLLGLGRLARCHPLHPGGLDPVPPARTR